MNDFDNKDRKEIAKKNFTNKKKRDRDISEEQRFISKTKKEFKSKIENMRQEELWEDWDEK
jgi:hypothetical protein